MGRWKGIAAAFALLLTTQASGQAIDHTILVDWNPLSATSTCRYFIGTRSVSYTDTAGANWTHLRVRIPMSVFSGPGSVAPAMVSIAINGTAVGNPVVVSNATFCGPFMTYEFAADSLQGYLPFQQNTFTVTSSGGQAGNDGQKAELTFQVHPRTFAFDLVPAMSEKVILHPQANDTNLSPWQVRTTVNDKPRFRFRGVVTPNMAVSPEADVWLRVVDPADPSPYLPQQTAGDNQDPLPNGVLLPSGCADANCRALPGQPLQLRSTTAGVVEVELEATDRYAGDNYYLEASFDPTFTCATAGSNGANVCARSGMVTAWKRVFIEKRKMLRNGLFLAEDAAAGDTFIVTRGNRWRGNRGNNDRLSKGENIVIVHAPQLDRSDLTAGWYSDVHTILSVEELGNDEFQVNLGTKQGKTVVATPLLHDYRIDENNRSIGDAIAKIDTLSATASDVFDAPMDLVTGEAFLHSFTENVVLPDSTTPGANVPVAFMETDDQALLQQLAEKWSSVFDGTLEPNHQMLIIGSDNNGEGGGTEAGVKITGAGAHRTSSWVFWASIEQQLKGKSVNNASAVNTWAKKTAAHEIAHQWETNGVWNLFDHCPATTKVWNDPSLYCLLAAFDPAGSGLVAQRTNGISRFHLLALPGGGTHSEYLEIRRRVDPFVP